MVSYANYIFKDNYTMGYKSDLIKLCQLSFTNFASVGEVTVVRKMVMIYALILYRNVRSLLLTYGKY